MQIIHYGHATVRTDDAVAIAVLDYALALSAEGISGVAAVPAVSGEAPHTARLLLGPGIPLAIDSTPDEDSAGASLDAREVEAALARIIEDTRRVRSRSQAAHLSSGVVIDDLWELSVETSRSSHERGAPTIEQRRETGRPTSRDATVSPIRAKRSSRPVAWSERDADGHEDSGYDG